MTLEIVYADGSYHVEVGPPNTPESHEVTLETPTEVLEHLSRWGCHSTDATDALSAANPEWTVVHDAEVRRRRGEGPGQK